MAMLCRDICRDLVPPAEYFDYGLWIPAGKYRPDSEDEMSDTESSSQSPKGHSPPPAVAVPPGKVQLMMQECGGSKDGCTPEQAANVARRLGLAPSLAEIEMMKSKYGQRLTEKNIEAWMAECAHNDSVDGLIKFFEYYDKGHTGSLTKMQVSNLLRTYGEPLSDQEFNAITAEMGMTGDTIDYRLFVTKLLSDN